MQHPKIAVIGAGVSGLSAAVALVESGFRSVTVFEARNAAGGRTRSYLDPATGDMLDNGQHLMLGCYRDTVRYIRTIGSSDFLLREPMRIVFHRSDDNAPVELTFRSGSIPGVSLLSALVQSKLFTLAEKTAAIRFGLRLASSGKYFEEMTCQTLFERSGQPTALIRKLWEPMVLATINAPIEQASATLFVNVLREAFLAGGGASDLLLPTVGLSELLIDPAIDYLERHGAQIRLSAPVRTIEKRTIEKEDEAIRIVTDEAAEVFDAVIHAAPQFEALPEATREKISTTEFSPIVNAYFWLDREIFSGPVHAFLGTTLQWAFPKQSRFSEQRVALTVSAAEELVQHTNEEIRQVLWTDLCLALPAARDTRLVHHQIIREKRATPRLTPDVQSRRCGTETAMAGFFLAGDFMQNGLPATIEGAIRNGYSAAQAAIRFFARR